MPSSVDLNALFRVDGIVAVITGAGTGIGFTMAKALAFNGAKAVYILRRRLEVLTTAALIHPSLIPIKCDITSKTNLQTAVDRIATEQGYINLLIANSRHHRTYHFSPREMNDTLSVNITAAFFTMTAFLELLDAGNKKALEGGLGKLLENDGDVVTLQSQVIFTTSISAFSRHWSSSPPYLASKVAIMQITKHASTQLARHGIRVNAIAPGIYPSELAQALINSPTPATENFEDQRFIPARRFGTEEEIARAILYLASRWGALL